MQKARGQTSAGKPTESPPTACEAHGLGNYFFPSGVLFTFPSRYLSLSVASEYFSLEDGSQIPRIHVSAVLGNSLQRTSGVSCTGLSPLWWSFPGFLPLHADFCNSPGYTLRLPHNPKVLYRRFGFPFAHRY